MLCRYLYLLPAFLFFSCDDRGNGNTYRDISFYSNAFKSERWYRIYLPKDYDRKVAKKYPVVYYFHGYGGRYKWDTYDIEEDVNYRENGRKSPPFVMEWQNYVNENDLIIVTWDGYEPNLHEGRKEREGIKYGNAPPYDYVSAHEQEDHHWGWDFSLHFRELVKHVDEHFRTIPDRGHRGITGLSMGGLTAYYIAGQNKDLVNSVSAFDPADNLPKYGPKGQQVVFPILEMHRSLKGLAVRLTMTDGDWLKYNNQAISQLYKAAGLSHFETHLARYPDHWAADIDKQLDFHMKEFGKSNALPYSWNHVNPSFSSFETSGYSFGVVRPEPALTILENVSQKQIKILARDFIPDGPLVRNEKISVLTPAVYSPDSVYSLVSYNLSKEQFEFKRIRATAEGRLSFGLDGGGHLVGINGQGPGSTPKLNMVFDHNQENFYFESGVPYSLNFKLVNTGENEARNIEITASSSHSFFAIDSNKVKVERITGGNYIALNNQFRFSFTQYNDSIPAGSILFEIKADGTVLDTARIMVFPTPKSSRAAKEDVIILDGRSVDSIPVYRQGPNVIEMRTLAGGEGNGNGVPEPGEKFLVYIRLPKGIGPNDTNTFHRAYLVNHQQNPYVTVEALNYEWKSRQAGATSVASIISLSRDMPRDHQPDLWLRVESLYNDAEDPASNAAVYAHRYDYVRVELK